MKVNGLISNYCYPDYTQVYWTGLSFNSNRTADSNSPTGNYVDELDLSYYRCFRPQNDIY